MTYLKVDTASKTTSSTDLTKLFLQSATVSGRPKVFFLGPFGRRVSFGSQQRRALNTVWAAGKTGLLDDNPNIAVIGGGLAGVMTCAALIASRCNVTLIEANDALLERQESTAHRFVHPTVNFWPEKPLNPTTELPYLDWYENQCSDVISSIRREWKEHFEKGLSECLLRTRVEAIKSGASGDRPVLTMVRNHRQSDEYPQDREFDLVFVASGFGEERTLQAGEPSYWSPDRLESRRDAGTKSFFIAGTGDGGLIDALRLVQTTFDGGRICLKVIRELDKQGISQRIAAIEKNVWQEANHDGDKASILFEAEYRRLLETVSIGVREELAQRHAGVQVTLIGSLPRPFGLYVAPIHKLLIASAVSAGSITYVQATLVADRDWYQIRSETSGSLTAVPRDANVVVRIGPQSPLGSLLDNSEVQMLRDNQRKLADILEPVALDLDFFRGYGKFPKRDVNDVSFVKSRKRLIDDYLFKNHRVSTQLAAKSGRPRLTLLIAKDANLDVAEIPNALFGIDIDSRPFSVGKGL